MKRSIKILGVLLLLGLSFLSAIGTLKRDEYDRSIDSLTAAQIEEFNRFPERLEQIRPADLIIWRTPTGALRTQEQPRETFTTYVVQMVDLSNKSITLMTQDAMTIRTLTWGRSTEVRYLFDSIVKIVPTGTTPYEMNSM